MCKKIILILFTAICSLTVFAGCSDSSTTETSVNESSLTPEENTRNAVDVENSMKSPHIQNSDTEISKIESHSEISNDSTLSSNDKEFLRTIKDTIINKNKQIKNGISNTMVLYTEINKLKVYSYAKFDDNYLKSLSDKYLYALKTQEKALNTHYAKRQILWQEGLVSQYEVLIKLHNKYDIFSDNTDLVDNYTQQLSLQKEYLQKLKDINENLTNQLNHVLFDRENLNTISTSYTNNTNYDFDLDFYFTFYDSNKAEVCNTIDRNIAVSANKTNKLIFNFPVEKYPENDNESFTCTFNWIIKIKMSSN